MDYSRLSYLFEQYEGDKASDEELNELFAILTNESDRPALLGFFEASMRETMPDQLPDIEKWKPVIAKIVATRAGSLPAVRRMWRYAAAAVITLLVGLGVYYVSINKKKDPAVADNKAPHTNDVAAPATTNAFVMLADGRRIVLDSVSKGELAKQGNTQLVKLADGKIAYRGTGGDVVYNTLFNPGGSQVARMTLSDGSEVWLNAGSSIKYPVVFTAYERKVEISGEAYFEVAHNKAKPFLVGKDNMQVEVLGTHFNVNAYEDEDAARITLLEGSVKVSGKGGALIIKPGEQAVVNLSTIQLVQPDVEQVMAWKNGYFHFNRADIPTVMKQLARWYDLEIIYEGAIPKLEFGGEIQRDLPLSSVLRLLEKSNVRLHIEGRRLTVLP